MQIDLQSNEQVLTMKNKFYRSRHEKDENKYPMTNIGR